VALGVVALGVPGPDLVPPLPLLPPLLPVLPLLPAFGVPPLLPLLLSRLLLLAAAAAAAAASILDPAFPSRSQLVTGSTSRGAAAKRPCTETLGEQTEPEPWSRVLPTLNPVSVDFAVLAAPR
jgi:hypothetical protein